MVVFKCWNYKRTARRPPGGSYRPTNGHQTTLRELPIYVYLYGPIASLLFKTTLFYYFVTVSLDLTYPSPDPFSALGRYSQFQINLLLYFIFSVIENIVYHVSSYDNKCFYQCRHENRVTPERIKWKQKLKIAVSLSFLPPCQVLFLFPIALLWGPALQLARSSQSGH